MTEDEPGGTQGRPRPKKFTENPTIKLHQFNPLNLECLTQSPTQRRKKNHELCYITTDHPSFL
jgi:hypothetical protein